MDKWTPAGVFTLLLLGIACLLGLMATTFPDALDRTAVMSAGASSPPLTSRVVMIIVGSLRQDASHDPSLMPHLIAARRHGSWGILQTSPIPISAAFIWAFSMGRPFTPLDIFHDFYPYPVPPHSTIHLAVAAGRRVCLVGEHHLTSPFAGVVQRTEVVPFTSFRDMIGQDEEVFQRSSALVRSGSCDLLVLHLVNLDKAGHVYGGVSDSYRKKAARADAMVGALQEQSEPGTTFLVVSDHGTNDEGDHAMPEPIVRDPPFILWGTGAAQGVSTRIRQIDVGPLLAALLGFPVPPNGLGSVPVEVLTGPAPARRAILMRALEQKERYLRAYARQHDRPQVMPIPDRSEPGAPPRPAENLSRPDDEAVAALRRLDTAYWTDIEGRASHRMALGGTIGAILLSFLGFVLCRRGLGPSAGSAGDSATAGGTIGLAAAITLTCLLPVGLWESGPIWGAPALIACSLLGVIAMARTGGKGATFRPWLATAALLLWGIALLIPAWWPSSSLSLQLPGFHPAFLFRHPLGTALAVTAIGGILALGLHRTSPANAAAAGLAAIPVLSLSLVYTATLFHDLMHWACSILASAALWALPLRRRVSRATAIGLAGLLTILVIRRMRGLSVTGALADVWWFPLLACGVAVVLLRHAILASQPCPSPIGRYRPSLPASVLGLFPLPLLLLVGAIRHLDLQTLSRWAHPILFGLVVVICLLTHDRTARLAGLLGAAASSAYLLFDPYGFLAMVTGLGVLLLLCRNLLAAQAPRPSWDFALLCFSMVWLLFFATGNEFDLTAVNALRKGMLGSDVGGAEGFSLGWTIFLVLLKLLLLHLFPLLALVSALTRRHLSLFDWVGFLVMGATLHFSLFLGFFVRYTTVGYSATGGILVSATSCAIFLATYPVHLLGATSAGEP